MGISMFLYVRKVMSWSCTIAVSEYFASHGHLTLHATVAHKPNWRTIRGSGAVMTRDSGVRLGMYILYVRRKQLHTIGA